MYSLHEKKCVKVIWWSEGHIAERSLNPRLDDISQSPLWFSMAVD